MALGVVQEGALPLLEHPAGEERGDQDFLGATQPAHVDQDNLAFEQLVEDPPSHRNGGVGGDAGQVHDTPGPAVHDLEGAEGHLRRQLHVPEAGEVLHPGELRRQPPRAEGPRQAAE